MDHADGGRYSPQKRAERSSLPQRRRVCGTHGCRWPTPHITKRPRTHVKTHMFFPPHLIPHPPAGHCQARPRHGVHVEHAVRNARIKKYGRRFTNWRPLVDGFTSYSYIDRRSKKQVNSERRYNSSAVHQLLERVALSEQGWHTNTRFTSTDKLRLQTQLRSTLIKVEIADAPPTLPPVSILSELSKRLETP